MESSNFQFLDEDLNANIICKVQYANQTRIPKIKELTRTMTFDHKKLRQTLAHFYLENLENTISRTGLGIVKLQGIYKWLREDTDSVLFEGIQSQLSSLCEQWKDILGLSKSFVE